MNTEEKTAFIKHQEKYSKVMEQVYNRARIPWQLIIQPAPRDPRLEEWFGPEVLAYAQTREQQRLLAERAGKILFNINIDEPNECDPYVLQGKKKARKILFNKA